jgi:hypothetical protein
MENETNQKERHFAEDHIYQGNRREPYIKAISYFVFGLFFITVGIVNFLKLKNWEQAGGTYEMNQATELMHKIGGKWFILAFMVVLGIVIGRKGFVLWKRIKTQERI